MAALVTCADGPIGCAVAVRLGRRGLDVVVHYERDDVGALETVTRLNGLGVMAHLLQADLCEMDQVESLVSRAVGLVGQLTVLINLCADEGQGTHQQAATRVSYDFAVQGPDVGVDALQEVAAQGCIVDVIDETGQDTRLDQMGAIVVKSAFDELTKFSAKTLAPATRVNAIRYGPKDANDTRYESDFLATVDYLIEQSAVTGQTIHIPASLG